jgi:hypothetical protein
VIGVSSGGGSSTSLEPSLTLATNASASSGVSPVWLRSDRSTGAWCLTGRGASVPPVAHAAAERVERHRANLTSPQELEALRESLLRLLTKVRDEKR